MRAGFFLRSCIAFPQPRFVMDPAPGLGYSQSMQITSTSNERVKHARRVREGREPGLIFIEGVRLAAEALASGLVIEGAFADALALTEPKMALLARQITALNAPFFPSSTDVIRALGDTVQSQGIILLARRPKAEADTFASGPAPLILGFDRLQDPGNVGTLIRTAEAAGVEGVVSLKGSADIFSPKALRSAMGSAFRLPLIDAASATDLLDLQNRKKLRIVAAAGDGEQDYTDYDWNSPTLLLLGNEGGGVAPELMARCDQRLRIPMHGPVESLNVAAAGAVMLFEAARQRRLKTAAQS